MSLFSKHKRKVWIRPAIMFSVLIAGVVWLSISPPPADWIGMGRREEKAQITQEDVSSKGAKTTITTKIEQSKTLWDWMGLLLAPATLAGLGFLFQISQEQAKAERELVEKRREKDEKARDEAKANHEKTLAEEKARKEKALAEEKANHEKTLAEDKAREEKARAEDKAREDSLEAYLGSMSALLVDKGLSALAKRKSRGMLSERQEYLLDAGLDVIRARTSSILRRLSKKEHQEYADGGRKSSVLLFLYETELIQRKANEKTSTLNMQGIDFSHADLSEADLSDVTLSGANLKSANFSLADLSRANLSNTKLQNAKLNGATLRDTDLRNAKLNGATLKGTYLSRADLSGADLSLTDLSLTDLSGANLSGANLKNARFWALNLMDKTTQAKEDAQRSIQSAKNWEKAQYSPDIREWLGLPAEPPKQA